MRDRLYLKLVETPCGNRAHEVVALVSAEAVAIARGAMDDANARARGREESAALRVKARRLADTLAAWRADVAAGIGRGSKAGW